MSVKKTCSGFLLLFVGFFISNICYGDQYNVVLIAHKSVPNSISKESIKQIFLGKKTRWDGDTKIVFAVSSDKNTCIPFLKEYVGKTYSQYRNYWKKQVFTGKGRMPMSFNIASPIGLSLGCIIPSTIPIRTIKMGTV